MIMFRWCKHFSAIFLIILQYSEWDEPKEIESIARSFFLMVNHVYLKNTSILDSNLSILDRAIRICSIHLEISSLIEIEPQTS